MESPNCVLFFHQRKPNTRMRTRREAISSAGVRGLSSMPHACHMRAYGARWGLARFISDRSARRGLEKSSAARTHRMTLGVERRGPRARGATSVDVATESAFVTDCHP